jgi:glycosyltransferase involved in cell wall biosynthesis
MKEKQGRHIVILTHSYPRFRGDWRSNFIEALAVAYRRLGLRVTVLVPLAARWERPSVDEHGVRIVPYRYAPLKAWHVLGYGDSLKGDLSMNLLHALLVPFLFVAGTVNLLRLLRREDVSFVHCHWAIPNAPIALAARLLSRRRTKVLTSFPGSDVTIIQRSGILGRMLAKLIARSDYLSCNSSDLKEDLIGAGIPANKIHYEIYGVDDSKIHFDPAGRKTTRENIGAGADETVLLMVGRFVAKKGFATGIKAMRQIAIDHPKTRLYIIGSGLLEPTYRALIHELGIESLVVFLGEVLPSELKKYYSACDLFLMPSERFPSDGLNVVVVEAMACGRPIIASAAGGNDLVVRDGQNGFLHQPEDSADLADKASRLILNSELRTAMGGESARLVHEQFTWDAIARRYVESYLKLLDAADAPSLTARGRQP